jgi:hypothetical protein
MRFQASNVPMTKSPASPDRSFCLRGFSPNVAATKRDQSLAGVKVVPTTVHSADELLKLLRPTTVHQRTVLANERTF